MISEVPLPVLPESGNGDVASSELDDDLGALLGEVARRRHIFSDDRERDMNMFRSGSAPPTMEGALAAVKGLLDPTPNEQEDAGFLNGNGIVPDDELRADPAYQSYYYSHANLNPRLPPPVLSKEDWRSTQRLKGSGSLFGGIGDGRRLGEFNAAIAGGLFSQQQLSYRTDENEDAGEWVDGGCDGLIGLSLGRQRSFADIIQDNIGQRSPAPELTSRAASRNSYYDGQEPLGSAENLFSSHDNLLGAPQSTGNGQNMLGLQINKAPTSQTFASVLGSSRSATPDPQVISRVPSPGLPPVGVRMNATEKKVSSMNSASSNVAEHDDILADFSNMNLSSSDVDDSFNQSNNSKFPINSHDVQMSLQQHMPDSNSYIGLPSAAQQSQYAFENKKRIGGASELKNPGARMDRRVEMQRSSTLPIHSYQSPSSSSNASPGSSPAQLQNIGSLNSALLNYGLGGFPINPAMMNFGSLPPLFESAAAASAVNSLSLDSRNAGNNPLSPPTQSLSGLARASNQGTATAALQSPLSDPLYVQYLASQYAAQVSDSYLGRNTLADAYSELSAVQKAYAEVLLQQQKQYAAPFLGKSAASSHSYYGNLAYGMGMSYPGSPLGSPVASPVGPGSPLRVGERNLRYPSNLRNIGSAVWNSDMSSIASDKYPSTLLDEFKSNKTRSFELAEIAGHVYEFSTDQYGSRFIQQKLETATTEEKNMVYDEIMPHALSLMTDVFGNYVVQKFFEHGSAAQKRELTEKLYGNVLALSLQMYGCRVIQKAIEVVDLDQKKKMVTELDGHIMRCVRDQNGNHVIQKCIECVPEESIQFIISTFYNQVVQLSTHPYGCRVIQRVLEHCCDPETLRIVMEEILQSVCLLAQDQYGNYVIQHVLEHGKPQERSFIIEQLAGQIVDMSQQKFASNVVEKCLTFGDPRQKEILISEMLGTTDENEPLQAMMKDQFGNYVVQKVLETCDDQQRELILSRVKVHLSALKKYTYGKHIVARVEKLVAAGERRIGMQSQYHTAS